MYTKKPYSMGKGLIARPDNQTLIYAYPVTITVFSSAGPVLQDSSFLLSLAELATQSAMKHHPAVSLERLQRCSPAWTTQSIFGPMSFQASLLMRARIKLSEQSRISIPTRGRPVMLVLASQIVFAGSTATVSRIREVTSYALNLFSDGLWQEPPPNSIYQRKAAIDFTNSYLTLTASITKSRGLPFPLTKESMHQL